MQLVMTCLLRSIVVVPQFWWLGVLVGVGVRRFIIIVTAARLVVLRLLVRARRDRWYVCRKSGCRVRLLIGHLASTTLGKVIRAVFVVVVPVAALIISVWPFSRLLIAGPIRVSVTSTRVTGLAR